MRLFWALPLCCLPTLVGGLAKVVRLAESELAPREDAFQDVWVVASIFSGRRDRLSVLAQYVEQLVARGDVDEVDFMLVGEKVKPDDRAWVKSFVTSKPGYNVHEVADFQGVYAYFAEEWRAPASCRAPCQVIWVKIDDDVVFVDVPRFREFVLYTARHPEMFLVHANIVNNGVTAYYQQAAGATPANFTFEYPMGPRGVVGPASFQPEAGGVSSLMMDPAKALALHREFVCDPASFAWDSADHGGCLVYGPPPTTEKWVPGYGQGRLSISFFATRFENMPAIVELSHRSLGAPNDEEGLTALSNRTECFYTRFNVAHLSFVSQHYLDQMVLPWYASASERARLCNGSATRIP